MAHFADRLPLQLQAKEGIDAVIVDSVLKIRKGLTESESASFNKSQTQQPEVPTTKAAESGIDTIATPLLGTLTVS